MPAGEIEYHPYLEVGQIPNATRLILGSFPVYECTKPDNAAKQANREKEGTISFFYGSADSKFWSLYGRHVDENILPEWNPEILLTSLTKRGIAISDLIYSCQRREYSSEDGKLFGKTWNRKGIRSLLDSEVVKILCTSKGVLEHLGKSILHPKRDPVSIIDCEASVALQHYLIRNAGGDPSIINRRVASVFSMIGNWKKIEAVAIPSPGSPQRQLHQFGFGANNWREYANKYYYAVFRWFLQER